MATYYVELDGGQLAPKTTLKGGDMTPKLQFEGAVIYPVSGGGGSANLQTKSATVSSVHGSASTATITPDPGYDGMDEVDLTISPIADGSVVVDDKSITISSPFSFDATTGKISSHILNTTQGTATVTPGYVSSATPGDINVYTNKDQQLDVVGATTYYPSTSDQTIATQQYLTGAQTFKGVTYSGLDAGNIKKDVVVKIGDSADDDRIVSVTGTYEGSGGYTADQIVTRGYVGDFVAPNATSIAAYLFDGCTTLTSFSAPNVTSIQSYAFVSCTNLVSVYLPKCVPQNYAGAVFRYCSKLEGFVTHATATLGYYDTNFFQNCAKLAYFDARSQNFKNSVFDGCSILNVVVIRNASVCALASTGAFNGTPFASNGAGGTLYVPSSMIASYQGATNWSTILGYANNQIKSIESTHTDPTAPIDLTLYYADGTPIS